MRVSQSSAESEGFSVTADKPSTMFKVIRVLVYVALTAMFLFLFYHEATGEFPADVTAHIKYALSENSSYSLIYPFLAFSYLNAGPLGVGVFLTIIEMATIVVCERFLRKLLPDVRIEVVFVLAVVVNFVTAIYLPVIHPHFTKGLSVGNSWHNSTYLGMKLVSLIAVWAYLRYVDYLESKNKFVDWCVFCVCVVASVSIKPSFAVIFGPTLVVLCVVDLVRDKKTLKRSLTLAVPFVIALAILAYQYTALYVEDTSSGIGFGLPRVWRHNHFFFPLGMLQSYAFPFLVFIFCWRKFKGDRNYRMALIMFFIALCIYLFVNETGSRTYHGNFGWSLKFGVYYLFVTSIVIFCRAYAAKFPAFMKNPTQESDLRPSFWPELFMLLVLGLHFFSGFGNILKMLLGHGYG